MLAMLVWIEEKNVISEVGEVDDQCKTIALMTEIMTFSHLSALYFRFFFCHPLCICCRAHMCSAKVKFNRRLLNLMNLHAIRDQV